MGEELVGVAVCARVVVDPRRAGVARAHHATQLDPDLWYVSVSRSPFAAHGKGDGESRLLRSRGEGFSAIDSWGDDAELRRMPYALATFRERPARLLVALRGGTLLLTDDAGESWRRLALALPDVIALAAA